MNPDYIHLYRELGVQPGCSFDEFRQAYRRHVAGLHPDRIRNVQLASTLPLPDLIALYDQAMRFHRRYGRLPGTTPASPAPMVTPAAPAHTTDLAVIPEHQDASMRASPRPHGWLSWLVGAAILLLVIGVWQTPTPQPDPPQQHAEVRHPLPAPLSLPAALALGMDHDTVFAIQGEPSHRRDEKWEYGPSWITFEKGRVVDWYSSPLYRLKTRATSPQQTAGD